MIRTVSDDTDRDWIPVMRPRLPPADGLLPYLRRIDEQRTYSNWGPLTMELGTRLGEAFDLADTSVVCANSGMSALMAGILATAGFATRERRRAIVPDFTFAATALAVQMCGYEPVLASCDRETWSFDPGDLAAAPGSLDCVGLVVPVAPFGRPVPQAPWQRFQEETGIPVVIDGAACFESLLSGRQKDCAGLLPVALSFHATKAFGIGEGGCMVTTNPDLSERVLRAMNFGFLESRSSESSGFNGKMPEYTAAVGLAELDGWTSKQRAWQEVTGYYQTEARSLAGSGSVWTAPAIASSYALLECASPAHAASLMQGLGAGGIDTRLWYGDGLKGHGLFKTCARLDVHGERTLDGRTLVGLPMAPDLTRAQVRRICARIAAHPQQHSAHFASAHARP
jgi:dTDP-4-amino-4,6-dideoxygalactose transaminase